MGHAKKKREDVTSEYALFRVILDHLWNLNDGGIASLASAAGVSGSTLYFWRNGDVTTPRIDTLTKVGKALGYEMVFKRLKRAPLRRVK